MECGLTEQIERDIRKFSPKDTKLLLALFLGSYLIHGHKVTEKDEKTCASSIMAFLSHRVDHLRRAVRDEFKTELLEMRHGEIHTIATASSGG